MRAWMVIFFLLAVGVFTGSYYAYNYAMVVESIPIGVSMMFLVVILIAIGCKAIYKSISCGKQWQYSVRFSEMRREFDNFPDGHFKLYCTNRKLAKDFIDFIKNRVEYGTTSFDEHQERIYGIKKTS